MIWDIIVYGMAAIGLVAVLAYPVALVLAIISVWDFRP